ncbi:hypothetical protein AAON49_04845 [Pseudotenacibaculum sp. MALMAid0570]|uniref:hypothetical protein n=1 Tax=Pseudotenacibaculum sp. MALMAid0570 TaxID=3143938 RepID=UPI0032E00623
MKAQKTQKKIELLKKVILVSASIFVLLSFIVFYIDTVLDKESLYITLVKGILIFDFLAMVISNEIIKKEKEKIKELAYTFMVIRK